MALIMREAERYPVIERALKIRTGYIHSLKGRRIYLKNHNKMLWRDSREKSLSPLDALKIYALKTAPAFAISFFRTIPKHMAFTKGFPS